ncbi:ZYBA0S12-00254g1_1 [Zygosaccharomyces bailii CLIB 213]|uniref:diacylglycerol cholinephosphotransferase n=1 Tax=Zygosaccharomyces bailii (strain CLIB 213 / ATCC 58445 / CBS 680 / BCRC 21525 / NBRC 1098 / NCYC 1416 / NRRL Y-2227) TaxID=1333698 RepID=A0A8J2T9I1_ZYGB2|nr:ZYBA0S12-00254g1_1 [Zygosaccharomyces bailii CLIB 213]
MGFYVPHNHLANLKAYKYEGEDHSIVSKYVLKPFWNKFSLIFPTWMAPNVVTLSGLGFIVFNMLTVLYYDPALNKETPRWTYYSYAVGLFLYQLFDACDGIHARRTGQSGPLGELFDHCVDALNTTLSMFPFCSTVGVGYTYMLIIIQFACLCNFYLSTWEEYHTHKLFLSEFSGPVEGILVVCIAFILTGVFGPQKIWHTELTTIDYKGIHVRVESLDAMIVFSGISLMFNILSARQNVVQYYNDRSEALQVTERIEGREPQCEAMKGLMPFFVYYLSVFSLVFIEPAFISFPFVLSTGFAMAFVVGRIITAHLTKQSFPMINAPLLVPSGQLLLHLLATNVLGYESRAVVNALTWLGCGLTMGIHATFINDIIYDFTTFLDIYVLSIKHPKIA